jgi:type II secretory pathway pseudopilin PulG
VKDAGFTLVELVMAILVLFMALTASVQIIVSMVATTVANRHIDLAMSVATQTMETAVAFNCGGELLDPLWDPDPTAQNITAALFYSALQTRCLVDTNESAGPGASFDDGFCPAGVSSAGNDIVLDETFRRGFLPAFDQAQTDLGSRRFTVYKSSASFATTTSTGVLPVCTTIRMVWKYVDPFGSTVADDGTNDSLRLQRVVHVQWKEPRQTRVRWRELVQVAALPPDSKVVTNRGRITVQVGIGKAAALQLPVTGQSMTFAADELGFVNFPFLPPGDFTILRDGLPPTTVTITASELSQCLRLGLSTSVTWTVASPCHA